MSITSGPIVALRTGRSTTLPPCTILAVEVAPARAGLKLMIDLPPGWPGPLDHAANSSLPIPRRPQKRVRGFVGEIRKMPKDDLGHFDDIMVAIWPTRRHAPISLHRCTCENALLFHRRLPLVASRICNDRSNTNAAPRQSSLGRPRLHISQVTKGNPDKSRTGHLRIRERPERGKAPPGQEPRPMGTVLERDGRRSSDRMAATRTDAVLVCPAGRSLGHRYPLQRVCRPGAA